MPPAASGLHTPVCSSASTLPCSIHPKSGVLHPGFPRSPTCCSRSCSVGLSHLVRFLWGFRHRQVLQGPPLIRGWGMNRLDPTGRCESYHLATPLPLHASATMPPTLQSRRKLPNSGTRLLSLSLSMQGEETEGRSRLTYLRVSPSENDPGAFSYLIINVPMVPDMLTSVTPNGVI